MNREKIVAGNWKMNTDLQQATELVGGVLSQAARNGVAKVFFPPFPFLSEVSALVLNQKEFYCGAQNCSHKEKGAYTGEVAAAMIKSVGCAYVLIGHSERRSYFNETSEQLVEKVNQALHQNLKIIFCFGEQLQERLSNQHFETVREQLASVLKFFPANQTQNLILAYEPVWAIGTGETASPAQAQEMHAFIRNEIKSLLSEPVAESMSILYGGSCNAQNAAELFACADVDGGLIGGASLKVEDFCKIIDSF